jgi:Fe-Mn family superoxide dismutase
MAEHLKLYAGYVKNANSIIEKIPQYKGYTAEDTFAPYVVSELQRRFSFEYNGMRNHEVYFDLLSDGSKAINTESELYTLISKTFGSLEKFVEDFKTLAMTRGVGWAVLWYDKKEDTLLLSWVDEQHLGQLNGCDMIIACDMWEHAYVYDFPTSKKKDYIDAFFANLNWSKAEENLKKAK